MNDAEILQKLLECFYEDSSNGELHWSYREGVSVGDVTDKEFEQQLIKKKNAKENKSDV